MNIFEDIIAATIIVAAIMTILFIASIGYVPLDKRCENQFGKGWYGHSDGWGGGFCTDVNGIVKYPKGDK